MRKLRNLPLTTLVLAACAPAKCCALLPSALLFLLPVPCMAAAPGSAAPAAPHIAWSLPFAGLLLAIALFPLFPKTAHWWHRNQNKLLVSLLLSAAVLAYYGLRGAGFGHSGPPSPPGFAAASAALLAALHEYVPFMVLLFSLYVIAGGIALQGDLPAHPLTNTLFLGAGALLASLIGTTGASMLLIYALLKTNSERRYTSHTVCFFIIIVSNAGGCLTPLGDPPLFLGYLRGVPFLWPLQMLWPEWLIVCSVLLGIYFVLDCIFYRREEEKAVALDETQVQPLSLTGSINFLWLVCVILCTALLSPGRPVLGTSFIAPEFLREALLVLITVLSLATTPAGVRALNSFTYGPILEVACLFIGIFLTMQVPIEILRSSGGSLGITEPREFFWFTGLLSSFLDNAPTYVVFFETAGNLPLDSRTALEGLKTASGSIPLELLKAISLGAVFMGANTYVGNGPNFMVKSIAEANGVRMPSFFGYIMCYTIPLLLPLFAVLTLLFF